MSTLLVMAGGTGGHVVPALAVARCLRGRGVNVVWLGTRRGLESRVVPAAGFEMEWIRVSGLRGRGRLRWLLAPLMVGGAMLQTVAVILRRRPDALLGMGGFVSGPGGLVAWLLRRPLLIHEANAVAGFTNRWLARTATRVMTGFPGTFPQRADAVHVGNPVRADITALAPPQQRLHGHSEAPRLLVVGGSQGSRRFNEVVPAALARLPGELRPQVRHQCGRGNEAATRAAFEAAGVEASVFEFSDDMAAAYGWADLVISRAGAMACAEIAAAGVGSLLVPYPHAVGDHQAINAARLVEAGAAVMLRDQELTPENLAAPLGELLASRPRLLEMAVCARKLAVPDATERVATICLEVLHA